MEGQNRYRLPEKLRQIKPYDPVQDPYPYPLEAVWLTYDGLHPSDEGCEILADILADAIKKALGQR